jgi:hypothetical protein
MDNSSEVTIVETQTSDDIQIEYLDDNATIQKSYQIVKSSIRLLRKTDNYTMIPDIIRMQYRPTIINPGTIGSFLFGCFQSCYGDVFKICSPLCIDNVPSDEHDDGECKHQIWNVASDNTYKLINASTKSNHAYIYVNSDFSYFTKEDIETFKEKEVEYAQILVTDKSKHHILIKMTSVDKLPIDTNNESNETFHSEISGQSLSNESNYKVIRIIRNELYYILIAIIIIMIILLLVI